MDPLVCISLWQPWAQFIADGFKPIETRHWSAHHRGQIGIHASKTWDPNFSRIGRTSREAEILGDWEIPPETRDRAIQHSGQVIAVANLHSVIPYETVEEFTRDRDKHRCPPSFFEPPQYGFVLKDVRKIVPVIVRGQMGIFTIHAVVCYEDKRQCD
jgi:hypothetical protein